MNLNNLSSIYGLVGCGVEGDSRGNSRHGIQGVESNWVVAGRTFDALEVQSLSVCKTFHEDCSIGSRWQMPSM
jgi:hypothetical protein